ncbi:hypothetical protein C0992_001193 [Termitomyces sp. T32_za158]|nr:hypothetical protein C0992_001193 [Termitomyces sp. T32_za158]
MPSFLSKVFGRKKDDKDSPRRVADSELLDGKFEAVSPSATKFPEVANERQSRHKEKDSPFHVFRSKSRPSSPEPKDRRVEVPHLSLNLPGPKDDEEASRELGVVFDADPESRILSQEAMGRRRLNPLETLILVRACSEAITARVFNSAISSTKSPHDVAAVLRWGLRHLQLEGASFGKDDIWYKTFFDAERSAGWPPNGYSSTLAPLIPTSHLELLTATLELFSSLAAHAEANGISGSKLSKFFGLWLLTVERTEKDDDWTTFYARWERTGRMLEHLFLSRIRDDATESRMPTRLLELIQRYPYQTDPNADLLARPRFSTIQYDALFVRIETELSATADQPSHHPLRIISEAFKAEASFDAGENAALWESIRKSGGMGEDSLPGEYPGLSQIFADETLRFFSLVPMDTGWSSTASPSFNLYTRPPLPGSSPFGDKDVATTSAASGSSPPKHSKTPSSPISSSDVNSPIGPDWITFSTSGFLDDSTARTPLASTLMEKERDMEVTIPRPSSPRLSLFNGRKSSDRPRTPAKSEVPKPAQPLAVLSPVKTVSTSTHVSLVQLDEAFVDFWSDALLDPISSSWPAFIICKLRNVAIGVDGKRIEWLVLEQTFKRPPAPTPEASTSSHSHESPPRMRTSSPNSSASDSSFMFGSMFKKFGFLTSPGKTASSLPQYKEGTKGKRKGKEKAVGPMVGELGEILREEDEGKGKKEKEKKDETVRVRVPSPKPKKSVEASRQSVIAAVKKSIDEGSKTNGVVTGTLAAGAAVAIGGAAVVVAAGASEADKAKEPPPALTEPTTGGALVGSVASDIPQEIPAPAPVKEAIQQDDTANGPAAVQNGETPTVAVVAAPKALFVADSVKSLPVVSEPEAAQTVVEQAKAAEPETVSVTPPEEVKPIEHVAEPTVETIKGLKAEVAPVTEEVQISEHKAAPVAEDTEPKAVPAVEETKVLQPQVTSVVEEIRVPEVVDEAKAVETIVEESRTPEPVLVPAVKEAKVPQSEISPVVEQVKAFEDKPVFAVEDVKAPESVYAPVVEVDAPGPVHDTKPLEVAPIAKEAKVSEPEVVPVIAETKAFEPEVAPPVDEVKSRELEVMPISEEIKASGHEAAPVVEEIKPVEVKPVMGEAKASDLEDVPTAEEAKVLEREVAPPFEEKKTHELEILPAVDEVKPRKLEAVPIVEDTKVPEHEIVPPQEIKTAGAEITPVEKEIKASENEARPTVEEVKVPEPEIAPVVEESRALEPEVEPKAVEIKPTEREVASTVDQTKVLGPAMEETVTEPDLTPVVKEASIIPEAQEQVANETTTRDLLDKQREIEPEPVIPAKELFVEPLVKAEVLESEPAVESQTPLERALEPHTEVLPIEEKSELVVGKMAEPVAEDVAQPVGEETSKSGAVEVNEYIAQGTAETAENPIVPKTTCFASEPIVGEAVQPVVTEAHGVVVQATEPVVDVKEPVIGEPVQSRVPESRQFVVEEPVEPPKQPVVEETLGSAAQPDVEKAATTLVEEEAHEPVVTVARVTAEPVIKEIAEPEPVLDESESGDKVFKPEKGDFNEEVPVQKPVEDALVKAGSGPAEAVVNKEAAAPEVPIAEEAPVSAIEEKSTPLVESVVEEPAKAIVEEEITPVTKESAEVSAATPTEAIIPALVEVKEKPALPVPVSEKDIEDTPAPTIEVAHVEKPASPASDSEAAFMPVEIVAKEESPSSEPDVVKVKEETSPQVAFEVVETPQEKPVVEDATPSESEAVPSAVETTTGRTLEPVTVPAEEQHAPIVEEPVAAVTESASVVGLEKADALAVQEAVSERSAPVVEDVTDSAAPVKKVEVSAVEESDAERSTPVKAEPSSTASGNQAVGSAIEAENAVTKEKEITPEEPTSSATRSENSLEPTKQTSALTQEEAITPSIEEHTVSVAEPEHAPVEPVPSTDAAQEELGVHAQTKEVAPAAEEPSSKIVKSEAEEEGDTSTRTKEVLTSVEELAPSAAAEPEPEVKTLEAKPAPTTEDNTPIAKESSALSVPVDSAPIAADVPAESTDVVEHKEETLLSREEVAPVIKEPAPSAAEPEIGVVATEVESLPNAAEPVKKSAETAQKTTAPAAEEVAVIVEECVPSVKAPAVPAEAEAVPVDTGHTVKKGTNIANRESAAGENDTAGTPVPAFETPVIEEPAPANVVEPESKSEAHHPSASAPAGQHTEESIVGGTEVAVPIVAPIVEEYTPSPEAAAETKPLPFAQNEPDQEVALVTHGTDETSMRTAEEVTVNTTKEPIAEEPATLATESRAQAEAPAHTNTEPTPAVEEKVPAVDSKDAISAPVVEAATGHLVVNQTPVPSQSDAPATAEEPIQKPVLIGSVTDTSFPIAEGGATSIIEEHAASVDRELAVDIVESSQTADEPVNKSSAIVFESMTASVPMPVTEDVPAPLADKVKPLAAESEPVVETLAPVTVEPILAVTEESTKESVPVVEHVPSTEISIEEVPTIKKDTAPVEAAIVEEKSAKVTPVVQDTTEISNQVREISNVSVSEDDAIVVAENGNGHSAAVKEETTVSSQVPDTSATASAKD